MVVNTGLGNLIYLVFFTYFYTTNKTSHLVTTGPIIPVHTYKGLVNVYI